jgi:hypothetical protein
MSAPEQTDLGRQVLALAVFIVGLWTQSPGAYPGVSDDGLYLVVAKAVARGQGLLFIHQPDAPPAAFMPPLFPVIAGVIGFVFPDFPANLLLVQILNAALLAGAAWFAAGLARSLQVSPATRYAAVALGFLNVAVLSTGVRVVPEPLLVFWWFAGFAAVRAVERNPRWAVVTGAIGAAAVLTAPIGLAVLVGVTAGLYLRGHRRSAGVASGVAALLLAPWLVWSLMVVRTFTVSASIAAARAEVAASWADVTRFADPDGGAFAAVVTGIVAVAAVLGMRRAWLAAPEWIITLFVHLWFVPIMSATHRAVWLVFPSIVLLAAVGIRWVLDAHPRRRSLIAAATALVVVVTVVRNGAALVEHRFIPDRSAVVEELSRLFIAGVGSETAARAVVATDADALLHLHTERTTVPLIRPGESRTNYCALGADYIAVSGLRTVDEAAIPPTAERVFALASGPALYRLVCD